MLVARRILKILFLFYFLEVFAGEFEFMSEEGQMEGGDSFRLVLQQAGQLKMFLHDDFQGFTLRIELEDFEVQKQVV